MARRQDIYCWDLSGKLVHHFASWDSAAEHFDLTRERVRQLAAKHCVRDGLLFTPGGGHVTDILLRISDPPAV